MKSKQKELPKKELTPEGKIWMVLKTINETISISPNGEEFSIDTKKLENYLIASDYEKIFEKLEKDYNAIKIIRKPSAFDLDIDNNAGAYIIKIPNRDNFNKALNNAHIKHFGSIEMLTGDNFFSVVDVSADIMNQLQMTITNMATIPLLPSVVRFSSLMPIDGINHRDNYCDLRWKAVRYLKDNKHIEDFVLNRDFQRWEQTITITIDRVEFTKFYEQLMKVYEKRVKFPDEETKQKAAATIPEPSIHKIEIVKGKMEIDGLVKGLGDIATKNEDTTIRKNKKVIRLPNFPSTPYKDATIRFLDERNVFISTPKKTATTDYEGLGFSDDKSKKPNLAWGFLLGVAKNNGETEKIQSPIPDSVKQIKRQISDFLKKLFKNDTEPFYDFSETNTYKIKITLTPPQIDDNNNQDKFGVKEYLDETMTSKYEFPKEEDD